jgi:hypothetical protein
MPYTAVDDTERAGPCSGLWLWQFTAVDVGSWMSAAMLVCTPYFVCAACALEDQDEYKRVQFRLIWSARADVSIC